MIHKRKYIAFILLVVGIFFVFSGCSEKKEEKSNETVANTSETKETKADSIKSTESLEQVTIQAPMGISIAAPLYKLVDDNNLGEFTEKINFVHWKNPDELRARIIDHQADISAVPTYVGANLYNKEMDVQLLNTLIWGVLYMIGPDGESITWDDLKGKTIHVPFKGDMPDLVFQYLLKKNNIDPKKDVTIEYVASPQEVVKLLMAEKVKYAILPEHVATLSVVKGRKEGKNLGKIMNLQEEWKKTTGREALIAQAGLLISKKFAEANPELVQEIQKQLEENIELINENPKEMAKIIHKYNEDVPLPVIEKALPSLNIKFVSASDAKEDLEFFFNELKTLSPDIIGGQLPDEGFYFK